MILLSIITIKHIPLKEHKKEIQKQCLQLSTKNMQCYFFFIKQLVITDINLTHAFHEEVKHHWGSFLVLEMLQEKLHCVVVSNVDTKVKIRWLKL